MRELFGELPDGMSFWHPAALISTWFGAGLMPIGPGTWGSAAALPFGFLMMWLGGPWLLVAGIVVITAAGWWAAGVFVKGLNAEDPPEIVVDEVVSQWLVLTITPLTWWGYLAAFLIFRIFDTIKPWPINLIDQNVTGAAGVMLDDLAAGALAFATMAAFLWAGWI
jgi:phosphatidylglycerophosphatase A